MKKNKTLLLLLLLNIFTFNLYPQITSIDLSDKYFGLTIPEENPEIFASGIISAEGSWEAALSYSPDYSELFFTRRENIDGTENRILCMKFVNGKWTEPEAPSFAKNVMEYESFITPDYKKIIFSSARSKPSGTKLKGQIWFAEKLKEGWSEAIYLDKAINNGWAMSVTSSLNKTLYFTGSYNGEFGIFYSEFKNGEYCLPVLMPKEINRNKYFGASHPYVSPDESFIIFDAQPDGPLKSDLYISFQNEKGNWGQAIKLPGTINTDKYEGIATISPDGNVMFFNRANDIYWVSTSILYLLKND